MNELIQIAPRRIGDQAEIGTVNARDLHSFLEVGKDFSSWIKDRISQFGFVEGADYAIAQELSTPKSGSAMSRAQAIVAYHLTIDMAKELAMVERNEKGKQARQYFIDCERRARTLATDTAADPMRALDDPVRLRQVLLGYTEKVIALETKVGQLEPKAAALARIAEVTDGSFCLTDAAKDLQVLPRAFTKKLNEMGWIYRRPAGSGWLAYQHRITQGVMEHKVTTGEKSDGTEWLSTQVRVTARGMAKLAEIFEREATPA